MAGLAPYWVGLAQIFINGLMQMPDPAFLIAGQNDLPGRRVFHALLHRWQIGVVLIKNAAE